MLKERIERLPDDQKRMLIYCLNNGFTQYVDLPNGKFVGVNVKNIPHLTVEEEVGVWSYGTNKKETP